LKNFHASRFFINGSTIHIGLKTDDVPGCSPPHPTQSSRA